MRTLTKVVAVTSVFLASNVVLAAEPVVSIYNWSEYIGGTTLGDFTKSTGVKTVYDVYDSNETLEAKLLTGHSGYDIVVPANHFVERQIKAGVFQKLDRSQLRNYSNLDPAVLEKLSSNDPGNQYAIPYMWGTTGIAYNKEKVLKALGKDSIDSWSVIFDPENIKKLSSCGVALMDSPDELFNVALNYIGKDPHSKSLSDYEEAFEMLKKIRPYVVYFHSSKYVADLANGNICIAMAYNGDAVQARKRAFESNNGVSIDYAVPKEGANIWFDVLAVPADAKNVVEAHQFIDFVLDPKNIAQISEFTGYANANAAASPLMPKSLLDDSAVYPSKDTIARCFTSIELPPKLNRWVTRAWTNLKSGG